MTNPFFCLKMLLRCGYGLVHRTAEKKGKGEIFMALTLKTFEVMQYFSHYDCNELAVVVSRIQLLTQYKSHACIVHDKDVLPNGDLKPPHFHAVVTLKDKMTVDSIANTLHVEPQYINKIKTTTKSARLYLVHRNNPEKYQYSSSDVLASFDYINYVDDCEPKQQRDSIAERIASGEIKPYNLFNYITVDEYAKNKLYYTRCFEYRQNKLKGVDRQMICYFITGGSGTGKTTYAKRIAEQKGYAVYISSGGKNPLDNYAGEECIILDDTRSSTWSLTDFLKLTDNHTDSLVGCRYYNKSIAECKLLIVTSVKSLNEFYQNAIKDDNEPQYQLNRRFSVLFEMTFDTILLCPFDPVTGQHVPQIKVVNPVRDVLQRKRIDVRGLVSDLDLQVISCSDDFQLKM